MWELDHKEGWALSNWFFWTVVLEKTFESPLNFKEIQLVNLKRNQSWIFTGRIDVEAEAPILWSPDAKNQLTGKDPDAGKDWRQEEKGMTEDETVGWHHRLNGHESGRQSRTGKPGVLQSMESQRVRNNWAIEQSQLYSSVLFDSSLYFLTLCYTCYCIHSPEHLYDYDLNSLLGRLFLLPSVLLLRFFLVPLFGIYSSVTWFCFTLCSYFYVSSRSEVTLPDLGGAALCRYPTRPRSILSCGHHSYML